MTGPETPQATRQGPVVAGDQAREQAREQPGQQQAGQEQQVPQYVYGVTSAEAKLAEDVVGLDDQPVSLVVHGRCAAVVGDLPQGRPLGERADLLAHQRVLDALVHAGTVVLPFRFGAALTSRDAVKSELLETNGERLAEVLEQLQGRVELRVKGTYVQENVLRELLTDDPEIAELNQRLREIPPEAADAAYYDRVRLGELIANAMRNRRDHDGQQILQALASLAERTVARTPVREEDVVDASFLVDQDRRAEFEQTVEAIAKDGADRVRLRLIGPLPPYDFVPEGA
ncbi:GvpL/GvpF family gas vesicle protein [Actinomadura namibiensis]|uniref:GvpL/GvpF family gas vesicle protein n=1 Tax=Actinomadura kijaniata TaxID=46161 RepID=UPI0036105837